MSEEMITNDKLAIDEEVKGFQEENKEIYEIMQSDLYKTLFQVLKRVTIKVEIVNIDQISSGNLSPGEKSPGPRKESKTKSESIKFQNIVLVDQSEKAYKFRNEAFEVEWFAQKGVNYNESTKELEVLGWWIDFVNSKGDPIEFKKEVK